MMARAFRSMIDCSVAGDLAYASQALVELIASLRSQSELHFLGVALTDLAYIKKAQGRPAECLADATEAVGHLESTSAVSSLSPPASRPCVRKHISWDPESARQEILIASQSAPPAQAVEVALEAAEIELCTATPCALEYGLSPTAMSAQTAIKASRSRSSHHATSLTVLSEASARLPLLSHDAAIDDRLRGRLHSSRWALRISGKRTLSYANAAHAPATAQHAGCGPTSPRSLPVRQSSGP
jgi:hypothetical protein